MNLPTIDHDKALHVIYGAALFASGYVAAVLTGNGGQAIAAGAGLTVFFAVGKEAKDWIDNRRLRSQGLAPAHGVEPLDAVATMAGGALVALPVMLATGLLTFPKG